MTRSGPVTLIGVGNMGGAMAANLLHRGWTLEVCDGGRPNVLLVLTEVVVIRRMRRERRPPVSA